MRFSIIWQFIVTFPSKDNTNWEQNKTNAFILFCRSTAYLHCILKDNAKQNKSMVLEYKIKKEEDRTEPPVTYSHPKSGIVMIHMTGGRTYGSIRMVLPMQEWRQNPTVRSGVEKRRDSVPCPPPLSNPYGQVWEHASVLIRILELSVCGSVKISIR